MKSFRNLNFKDKMEYIGISAIYPLILLYDYIGKYIKFFSIRKRQIMASVLTVCLMLTMIPLSAVTVFAATGNAVTSGTFATTAGKWNGGKTYNLIPNVTVPVTDAEGQLGIGSGEDTERWQAYWNNIMVPAGWGSDYISGDDDALQIYLPEDSTHYAIRPVQKGASGDNANLGGAGESIADNLGGVSYTVKLCDADMALAYKGDLQAYTYAELYR